MGNEEYRLIEIEESQGLKRFEVRLFQAIGGNSYGTFLGAYFGLPKFGHILLMEDKPNKNRLESELDFINGVNHDVEESNRINYQKARDFAERKTEGRIGEIGFVDETLSGRLEKENGRARDCSRR